MAGPRQAAGEQGLPALRAEGLWKAYDGRAVLRGASLEVAPGEAVAVLGANGAGKSTLLRLLAARARPDEGRVHAGGVDALREPARARAAVRLLEQHAPVLEELAVREHVRLLAAAHGERLGPDAAEARAAAWGLGRKAGARAAEMSRGQRQRLALLGAFHPEPPVLVLDEPFTALDDAGQAMLCERLAARRGRLATVVALHDAALAGRLCDRAVHLHEGRLEGA